VPEDEQPKTADLGYARVDLDREHRTGDPEVVFAAGKTPEQTVGLLTTLSIAHPDRAVFATRAPAETMAACRSAFPDAVFLAGTVTIGPLPPPAGRVGIVTAGTSDQTVADEVAATVAVYGSSPVRISDVGVAGLHRLLAVTDQLAAVDCLVVVAGMEGALPSVVGGLTGVPLIAVPTSVGYGASFGGLAALLAMLNSCAPGVTVCNIDNGFGAGVAAARIARAIGRARDGVATAGTRS
jgi:pyridinium-3,5-biscarboxylic acid mononucleotide synthase